MGNNFNEITQRARKLDTMIQEIADAAKQGIETINAEISRIDQITQANSASAEETASSSAELQSQADRLRAAVEELNRMVHTDAEAAAGQHIDYAAPAARTQAKAMPAAHQAPAAQMMKPVASKTAAKAPVAKAAPAPVKAGKTDNPTISSATSDSERSRRTRKHTSPPPVFRVAGFVLPLVRKTKRPTGRVVVSAVFRGEGTGAPAPVLLRSCQLCGLR